MPRSEALSDRELKKERERRRHERFQINMPGTIWYGGRPMVGVFVDISAGGALATASRVIPAGVEVVVEVSRLGRHLAKVVRTTDDGMGVKFTAGTPVDLSALLEPEPPH